jgi:hypothetical protein
VARATAGVLADPSDLLARVAASDLIDEDGNPDPEGIREAADSLLERKRTFLSRPGQTRFWSRAIRRPSRERGVLPLKSDLIGRD